ncbi:capsular biosynthesis protein [Parafrankia sp. BMG5.11]|uniref:capsular biosynthesis protein n=1 Tax=Parafrankia sp. BMG5.11 TaxID=222540 RepID=UPI0010389BC9|nr:capsular biosynthesis protein [Parafrankia sp. BMG5.11]TCJ37441.1 capsular biosynthesis protein [Parafrankia sp. BMG5.11]
MTEHAKIPLPPQGEDASEVSLFERASGAFALNPFRAAPVPSELAVPVTRRVRRTAAHASSMPEAATPPEPGPQFEASASVVPEPAAPEAPSEVSLTGPRHPIDRERLRDKGLIVPEDGATALLEEFRIIKRQVLASAHVAGDAAAQRILICSPLPGDGKTFCATNLAIAMAGERGGEVVLIDADFAKPSILATLGLPSAPGLMDALADPSLRVEDLVMATDIDGLFVLPAGDTTTTDSEWLASARTAEVLDRLTQGAPGRMLVFDSPPALAASPAADLAQHVGQAVLVARADKTGRSALEDAVHLLGACPDIKLLLNATHFSPSGRRFGTYYGHKG